MSLEIIVHGNRGPLGGVRVSVSFHDLDRGMTDHEYTDNSGSAYFNCEEGTGEVFVNGSLAHDGWVNDGLEINV